MMPAPRRWKPAPFIHFSFALHAAAAAALAAQPSLWVWCVGTLVANHALLTAAGLSPRSTLLGANMLRLPPAAIARNEIAVTIDDGPDPQVTPLVLDLLDRHGAKASFFVVGEHASARPDLVRDIVSRGHSVENHSQRHSHFFSLYGPGRFRREIESAQESIAHAAGNEPQFFRAPAGLRNPLLDPVLSQLGLHYVAWTRRGFDTVIADVQRVLDRLMRDLAAGDILLLHDGNAARTREGRPVILEVLPGLLERVTAAGLRPVSLRAAMQP